MIFCLIRGLKRSILFRRGPVYGNDDARNNSAGSFSATYLSSRFRGLSSMVPLDRNTLPPTTMSVNYDAIHALTFTLYNRKNKILARCTLGPAHHTRVRLTRRLHICSTRLGKTHSPQVKKKQDAAEGIETALGLKIFELWKLLRRWMKSARSHVRRR